MKVLPAKRNLSLHSKYHAIGNSICNSSYLSIMNTQSHNLKSRQVEDEQFEPYTLEEFNAKIDKAEEDEKAGRVTAEEDVIKYIKSLK